MCERKAVSGALLAAFQCIWSSFLKRLSGLCLLHSAHLSSQLPLGKALPIPPTFSPVDVLPHTGLISNGSESYGPEPLKLSTEANDFFLVN